MMHKAWSSIKEVSYYFSRSYFQLQGHTAKKIKLGVSGLQLLFEFTEGFEIMHTAWYNIEEVIILGGHPLNFKVTRAEKSTIWIQFE